MDIQRFFQEKFGEIRGVMIDGVPCVVGVDIAKCLGYKNPREAIRNHVRKKFRKNVKLDIPKLGTSNSTDNFEGSDSLLSNSKPKRGGLRHITVISEPGIYQLIFSSKMPDAEEFQDWVFEEVLPSIRRHGAYVDANHKQFRELSKYLRKKEAEAIGSLIHYGRKQGWLIDKIRLHAALTIYSQNDTCGIPIGGKDKASVQELYDLMCLETDIMITILKGINDGEKYDTICLNIIDMINEFKRDNFEDWTVFRYNSKNDVCYAQIEQKRKKIVVDTYDGETFEIPLMK